MQGGVVGFFNSPTFNVKDFEVLTFLVVSNEAKRGDKNLLFKILSMQIFRPGEIFFGTALSKLKVPIVRVR